MRTSKCALIGFALGGCLWLTGLATSSPLGAQQMDSVPQRLSIPSADGPSVLALPQAVGISLYGSARLSAREGAWTRRLTIPVEPMCANSEERSRNYVFRGAAVGALLGLVGYMAIDGADCQQDRDPQTGREIDDNERLNCVFQTSIPLYLGGGAIAGGVLGSMLERMTR